MHRRGRMDISFNAIAINDVQGFHLSSLDYSQFSLPIMDAMNSHFLTATAAVKRMAPQQSGVILALTANVARKPYENSGGFGVACAAIEAFCRQLAVEEGKNGIRVTCIRSAGSPDATNVDIAIAKHAKARGISKEDFLREFEQITMLKRLPLLREVAASAVFLASDKASAITAAVLNVTCGELAD